MTVQQIFGDWLDLFEQRLLIHDSTLTCETVDKSLQRRVIIVKQRKVRLT